jgi:hypothetical protein
VKQRMRGIERVRDWKRERCRERESERSGDRERSTGEERTRGDPATWGLFGVKFVLGFSSSRPKGNLSPIDFSFSCIIFLGSLHPRNLLYFCSLFFSFLYHYIHEICFLFLVLATEPKYSVFLLKISRL